MTSETCQGWLQDAFPEFWMFIVSSASQGTAQIILTWYITLNLSTLKLFCHLPSMLSFASFLLSSQVPSASWQWHLTTQNTLISFSDLEILLYTLSSRSLMKIFNKTSVSVHPSGTLLLKINYPSCKTTKKPYSLIPVLLEHLTTPPVITGFLY